MSPLVVALASDGAQDITGQCFFVWGGVVNVLQPWQRARHSSSTSAGTRTSCSPLCANASRGAKPIGMLAAMEQAGAGRCALPEHNLARAAEAALDRHGDHDALVRGSGIGPASSTSATRLAGALREAASGRAIASSC